MELITREERIKLQDRVFDITYQVPTLTITNFIIDNNLVDKLEEYIKDGI